MTKRMGLIALGLSMALLSGCGGSSGSDTSIDSDTEELYVNGNDEETNTGDVNGGDQETNTEDVENTAYILEKDENNKIFMEKADNGDFVTTELKDGKYTTTKVLVNGDTNVFEIEYQSDGVQLTYKGETEFIAIDDATQEQEIESQYIGIWREDVDEDWEGDIDIAYIYTDKAIVFIGNVGTGACSQTRTLNVSEFQSLLKNDIDVNDYVKATTHKEYIETSCGSYASLNISLRKKSILDWFKTPSVERDTELESNIDDVVDSSRRGPIDGLYGATIAGRLIGKIDEKIRSKDNWWPIRGVVWIYDKFKAVPERITTIVGDTADKVNSIYDTISGKNDNDDIVGIKDAVDDFEDNSYIDNGSPFEDSTFRYAEKDENGEIEVVESISYDSENKKVEEVPNYDENGNVVSITTRTYIGDDTFGAAYEEETVEVENSFEEDDKNIGWWFDYTFDGIAYEDRTNYRSALEPENGELWLSINAETADGEISLWTWRHIPIGDLQVGESVVVTETKTNYGDLEFTYWDNGTQVGSWTETGDNNGDMSFEVRRESDGYYFDFTIIMQPGSYTQSVNKTLKGTGFISNALIDYYY